MHALLMILMLAGSGEVARVQEHLRGAEASARAADPRALTPAQRARRVEVLDELTRYRARGEFPRNLDFAARTPSFIDDRGVRCAMAHLIETFGGAVLVARVAATANHAYVRELAADPELRAWLDAHGLTVAEAARIQPSYEAAVGQQCGASRWCTTDLCMPALNHPDEVSYCTTECDPAGDACPVGLQGVAMECRWLDAAYRCVYPEPTPGTTGWPCDLDTFWDGPEVVCFRSCVADRVTGEGSCIDACPNDVCEQGLDCLDYYANDDEPGCMPPIESPGCSTGGEPPALGMLALLLLLGRWRRRACPVSTGWRGSRDVACRGRQRPRG